MSALVRREASRHNNLAQYSVVVVVPKVGPGVRRAALLGVGAAPRRGRTFVMSAHADGRALGVLPGTR
ncbi:hypothetical protein [Streptomyces sp. GbtcB6]|uniref:hypothetical protein n=1 Tax=Streptomyces sp. GbtcB6 TaxID=2824751 RepID=UPI001C30C1C3|nr:hypothetical protein [Streptomyces sp. GbtcB6]